MGARTLATVMLAVVTGGTVTGSHTPLRRRRHLDDLLVDKN